MNVSSAISCSFLIDLPRISRRICTRLSLFPCPALLAPVTEFRISSRSSSPLTKPRTPVGHSLQHAGECRSRHRSHLTIPLIGLIIDALPELPWHWVFLVLIAPNGQALAHIPHPIHNASSTITAMPTLRMAPRLQAARHRGLLQLRQTGAIMTIPAFVQGLSSSPILQALAHALQPMQCPALATSISSHCSSGTSFCPSAGDNDAADCCSAVEDRESMPISATSECSPECVNASSCKPLLKRLAR